MTLLALDHTPPNLFQDHASSVYESFPSSTDKYDYSTFSWTMVSITRLSPRFLRPPSTIWVNPQPYKDAVKRFEKLDIGGINYGCWKAMLLVVQGHTVTAFSHEQKLISRTTDTSRSNTVSFMISRILVMGLVESNGHKIIPLVQFLIAQVAYVMRRALYVSTCDILPIFSVLSSTRFSIFVSSDTLRPAIVVHEASTTTSFGGMDPRNG